MKIRGVRINHILRDLRHLRKRKDYFIYTDVEGKSRTWQVGRDAGHDRFFKQMYREGMDRTPAVGRVGRSEDLPVPEDEDGYGVRTLGLGIGHRSQHDTFAPEEP